MTAKEYLNQAYRLDQRINSKIEQVETLNSLAMKCTATLSDMPKSPNRCSSGFENTIIKIIGLQEEINRDIDNLVDLKAEIVQTIKAVKNTEYQTLLEQRYLCFKSWEEIAEAMHYGIDNVFKLHQKALKCIDVPEAYSNVH